MTWRLGLPSSSGHALVGGLVGAAVVEGGVHAVNWGGMDGLHPVGVFRTLIALAVSPVLGFFAALAVIRGLRRAARRVTHRWRGGAQAGQWVTSAALSFSHGPMTPRNRSAWSRPCCWRTDESTPSRRRLGDRRLLGGAYGRHSARRLAHHSHRGPAHLSHPSSRGTLLPELIGGRNPRRLCPRCARLHQSSRRFVGGRNWCRTPTPATRQLGSGPSDRAGLDYHAPGLSGDRRGLLRSLERAEMTARRNRRWFLPETPDAIGLLRRQTAVTLEALEALAAWAEGDDAAAQTVRDAEPRGDAAKRDLLNALREAFILQMEPEDLFTLSRGIDWILDHARDLIEEAQAMDVSPDAGLAAMGTCFWRRPGRSTMPSPGWGRTMKPPPLQPTPRSRLRGASSTSTTPRPPGCSRSRTFGSASPSASYTVAVIG